MASSTGSGLTPGILREPTRTSETDIPHVLPHEKVFPIQIGGKLFRLSGASISSDAPSYFSQYFRCQLETAEARSANGEENKGIKTLYIDRDPTIFSDISRHLQGYHIQPRDGSHFVKLFADAQFYQLPRLVSQLFEDNIYISIGGREFRVEKDLFTAPGDTPNFFTLGFGVMFSSTDTVFPGLDRSGLLRPPSIVPPAVPSRSGDVFAELIHMLKGYPLHIRNEAHRAELLRDCRYFLFKGLEQKLIPHHISHNFQRGKEEITLRLEDIRQAGLTVNFDSPFQTQIPSDPARHLHYSVPSISGWVHYSRPFVDPKPYELILEISGECTRINIDSMRAEFSGGDKKRINRLFEVLANKINNPNPRPLGLQVGSGVSSQPDSPGSGTLGEEGVKIAMDSSTSVVLDGKSWPRESGGKDDEEVESGVEESIQASSTPSRKRRRVSEAGAKSGAWTVKSGQWRVRVQRAAHDRTAVECVLIAVKIDAFTAERVRNEQRPFLSL